MDVYNNRADGPPGGSDSSELSPQSSSSSNPEVAVDLNSAITRTTTTTTTTTTKSKRRRSFPLGFVTGVLFSSSSDPSSFVDGTRAEGRPVGSSGKNSTTATALRKLSNRFPSAAESGGSEQGSLTTTTTTGPVVVRTYSGGGGDQRRRSRRGRVLSSGVATTGSSNLDVTTTTTQATLSSEETTAATMPPKQHQSGSASSKPRSGFLLGGWTWGGREQRRQEEPKLPPLEAFSFRSFVQDAGQQQQGDISADLDRIAEICARSRYSLSNQYEVHVAPHGSGAGFVTEQQQQQQPRSRRGKKSVAEGRLETIMSCSRSCSSEGGDGMRQQQKGAGEVVEGVRGRKGKGGGESSKRLERKRSASFANAIMEGEGGLVKGEVVAPRVSGSDIGVRTCSSTTATEGVWQQQQPRYYEELPHEGHQSHYTYYNQNPRSSSGNLFGSWVPWQTPASSSTPQGRRNAEGRLRELLKAPSEGRR
ncbi:hypothetical protein QC764_211330 [Podospora pseudoanserina]|uniref:Uncharacterized protein n=1 Tax=Podospora pseudoanserina TaxID=2609844 RepID=A0ABR0IIL1_9PEZI|nr:hypothetical protein QC764_211330 [Podospora pseudoanserina]